jgi:hypothetical protein
LQSKERINFETDVYRTFKKLEMNGLADIRDPMGVSGTVAAVSSEIGTLKALSKLKTAVSRAEKADVWRPYDLNECFGWWKKVYNTNFPSR